MWPSSRSQSTSWSRPIFLADRGQLFGWSRPIVWLIAANCLADRSQLFDWSRPIIWLIAVNFLADYGQLFGWSRPIIWLIAANYLADRGQLFCWSQPIFFWLIAAAFWPLSKFICRLSTINRFSFDSIFWINLLLRRRVLPVDDRLRYWSRLKDERTQQCLHLCLRRLEPSFSKLSQDMQCHASTLQ